MVPVRDLTVKVPPEATKGREVKVPLVELSMPRREKVPGLVTESVPPTVTTLPGMVMVPPAPVAVRVMRLTELVPPTMTSSL